MRGMTEISFKTISLEGKELSFTKNLKKILNSNKIAIVLPSENPELRVELIGEESEKRILSLSGQGLVREYEIFYRVRYRVKTADKVYIVESSFDAIRLDQVGFPAVATLGANVSNAQIELLQKYFNNIIVIADNDDAGGNMKDKIIDKLGSRVSVIQLNKKYKDIGDMDNESIKELDVQFDKTILSMLN